VLGSILLNNQAAIRIGDKILVNFLTHYFFIISFLIDLNAQLVENSLADIHL